MACIQVYFAGALKDEMVAGVGVIGIGRNRDNTITIDNAGVSVSGERVKRRRPKLGDELGGQGCGIKFYHRPSELP